MADIKYVQIEPEVGGQGETLRILYPGQFHRCLIEMKGELEAHCIIPTADGTRLFMDIRFREEAKP